MNNKSYFPGIDCLRGLAALAVLFQHAVFYGCRFTNSNIDYGMFDFGVFGVTIFFVISGFVIGLCRHMAPKSFFIKRVTRIYPGYWATIILIMLAGLVFYKDIDPMWQTVLLLPSTVKDTSVYIPYWTLVFEMFFYTFMTILLVFKLSDKALTIVFTGVIILCQLFGDHYNGEYGYPGVTIFISPLNQMFAIGILSAIYLPILQKIKQVHFALGIIIGLILIQYLHAQLYWLVYGLTVGCIVLLFSKLDKCIPFLKPVGDASYGLYLIHSIVIVFTASIIKVSNVFVMILLLIIAGLSVGIIYGLIEKRLHFMVASYLRKKTIIS